MTARSLTECAYGKINLSLDVTGRREDGYHLVRMVMQTVDICDTITITRTDGTGIETQSDSGAIPSGSDNLVWRAADVMRKTYALADGLCIYIKKKIPVAAGMAGGSADAAAVFRILRRMYDLELSDAELEKLALPLGADIPYCITGGTKLCEGIGEVLTDLPSPPPCTLLVIRPDVLVSTGWVYKAFDTIPAGAVRHPDVDGMVRAISAGNIGDLCRYLGNVLEQQTGISHPVIGELERFCLERGALGSIMTGSGPTVFAVYDDSKKAAATLQELNTVPAYRDFMKWETQFVKNVVC